MFAQILCPVDFSDASKLALHHAASIARGYGAELHVLYVVVEPISGAPPLLAAGPALVTDQLRREVADTLRAFVNDMDFMSECRVHEVVRVGTPAAVIVEHATHVRADLIVLGTQGRTGLDRMLLGSTTERVLHRAPCTVLTIPPRAHEPYSATQVQFKRILCAVDFSRASIRAFEQALVLARESDLSLTLLHVLEMLSDQEVRTVAHYQVAEYVRQRKQETLEELAALVPKDVCAYCEVATVVELGAPGRVILRAANDVGAELIAMGAQGRGGLSLMLFGSTTQTVVRAATCPVLTARADVQVTT